MNLEELKIIPSTIEIMRKLPADKSACSLFFNGNNRMRYGWIWSVYTTTYLLSVGLSAALFMAWLFSKIAI